MPGTRNALIVGLLTCAAFVAASCSGGGGKAHDSTSPNSESSTPLTTSATSSSPTPSPTPSWTPPSYGTAKPPVDAYLTFMQRVDYAYRDPAHVPASTFSTYLAGEAKLLFEQNLAQEKAQGKAERGKTIRRVRVVQNHMAGSLKWAMLRDCATDDPRDPAVEYYVKTGNPVPQPPHNPPGPYADTIKIFLVNGQWTITSFTVDSTRTCKP
jgi:hypothetical protein